MENEKRLIYAERLKMRLIAFATAIRREYLSVEAIVDTINTEISVDAVEVVHGHWCWEGRFKACSNCGSYVEWNETLGANFWKFCPYCGAKVDKTENP